MIQSSKWSLIFLLIILVSCVGNRRMGKVSGKLQGMEAQQTKEGNQVNTIGVSGDSKLGERKIDSNINKRIQNRLLTVKADLDSVNNEINNLKKLTSDLKTFRKNYRKEIAPKLALLDQYTKLYNDRLKVYLMLEEGLNIANYTLFDLAAFFGPGKYIIPKEQEAIAAKSFMPLVDSVISFSNKYKETPRTATLVVLGFADGQNINPDGPLFTTLTNMMGTTDVNKEGLNKKLSQLRALELIAQLTKLYIRKLPDVQDYSQLKVEYIGQGKGEELPIPTINDYKEDDERRRIVLCYWAVLPNIE